MGGMSFLPCRKLDQFVVRWVVAYLLGQERYFFKLVQFRKPYYKVDNWSFRRGHKLLLAKFKNVFGRIGMFLINFNHHVFFF